MKARKSKIVEVHWIDSDSIHGWRSGETFEAYCKEGPCEAVTVGILAEKTKKWIVLLQTIGEQQLCGTIKIPRVAVISMKTLGTIKRNWRETLD